jgi:ketosteroid isomerase-like protein
MPSPPEAERSEFLQFQAAYEEGNQAFNAGDLERAFGELPEDFDFEFHHRDLVPDARTLRGANEIVAFYEEMRQVFPDWQVETREFIDAGAGRILVVNRSTGTGKSSGVGVERDVFQVWEFGDDGIPARVREYTDRAEAFAAAEMELPADSGND